jgi:hypothetical protein
MYKNLKTLKIKKKLKNLGNFLTKKVAWQVYTRQFNKESKGFVSLKLANITSSMGLGMGG